MDLPVFDLERMKEIVGDNPDIIKRLTTKFVSHGQSAINEITVHSDQQDWAALRAASHKFKSSARSVGAIFMGEILQDLENMALDKDQQQAQTLIKQLSGAFEDVKMEIQKAWI